jgi:DNA replication and repair protein RecF
MSVVLNELKLYNFRNHKSFLLRQPKRIVIIIGKNAAGKTNIIEALQLVSKLDSFRKPKWQTVITTGEDIASIEGSFIQNERNLAIKVDFEENTRSYFLNEKKKNRNTIKGLVPAVLFTPDDLVLVKAPSEARRNLVDELGEQLSQTYSQISTDYHKIVKQRNSVLKEQHERVVDPLIQESWDENLIKVGSLLFIHRVRLYKKLVDKASVFYQKLSENEELTSIYRPSFSTENTVFTDAELITLDKNDVEELLRCTLKRIQSEELARAKSLVGPHRDEITFFINNYEARQQSSQGQQRSIALALKLAELALIQEINGNQPLLLLDDVLSELDENRRTALIEALDGQLQTIITATDLHGFDESVLKNAQIINLDERAI